jgi:hypothetical protein
MLRFATYMLVFFSLLAGWAAPASATKRVALVIGNSAYEHAPVLQNPQNDAEALSAVLNKLGFEVVTGIDLSHVDFAQTVGQFRKKLKGADVGLFFYAGHGLQVNGENYLAPVDAELEYEDRLEFEAVTLKAILRLMERAAGTNLVFLDSCRDNPLARNLARGMGTRSTAIGQGLARVEAGIGTMIAFATQPGNVAADGKGDNSPFATALIRHIATPGIDISELMRRVRVDVLEETGRKQIPWNHSSMTAPFVFKKGADGNVAGQSAPGSRTNPAINQKWAIELAYWNSIKSSKTPAMLESYLKQYPKGTFAELAKIRIVSLVSPVIPNTAKQDISPVPSSRAITVEKDFELTYWKAIQSNDTIASYESYLKIYPKGSFALLANLKIEELKKPKPKTRQMKPTTKKTAPRTTQLKSSRGGRGRCKYGDMNACSRGCKRGKEKACIRLRQGY